MHHLGVDLRDLRTSAHLTQEQLAGRMGKRSDDVERQQSWVSEVENGSSRGRPIDWEEPRCSGKSSKRPSTRSVSCRAARNS
ncbi:helix-turn-helix transcriptional regulator [Amycolatopsis sp. NPDC024027]|uniref:helix-turn-helix transcriptional regulator n=1 Tax=Amycolatopsis sp. NPDC024027 TaxID=3154327 RepID=UPI0033E864CF